MQTIGPDAVHYVDLVREMVAYFDVIENKYGGAVVIDISADWPSDWLKRARKALPPSEDALT